MKGKKKRAKTDWADARHLRELLLIGRLPESWIPPAHILDLRARVRTRHLLSHQRCEWQQRMHSVLYHHGIPQQRNLLTLEKREWLASLKLPAAAREQLDISLQIIDALDTQLVPFDRELRAYGRKQAGVSHACQRDLRCRRADRGHDPRRARRHPPLPQLPRCRALRRSGHHRAPIRPAPRARASLPPRTPALRWALYEAAQRARFPASPDRQYYLQLAERIGGNRACLALSRKLLKRCHHILKELGDQALQPIAS